MNLCLQPLSLPKQFDSTRGRSLGAMGHWTLRSLLSRQPQEPVIQTPDYKGIFANKYLRKQKRSELRAFLASDAVYAIVEGPPGSGKTACIQDVAAELHYALKELDVEGEYKDERSLSLARSLFNHDMADILRGNDGSKVVTLVYNVNIVENPGVWVLPERKEKTTKVIFELHDTPKEMAPLIRRGLVRKITFEKFQPASLKMIAAAIGFRNPPGAVLECGDAHMLYTASVTRDSDAWKDAQLKPFSEAEELLRGHRTDMSNDLTPFFLHQHCGQFMSLEAGASFLEDLALADTIATASWKGGSASETDHHYSLDTCPFLAVSAAHYADSLPSRIDWSGKLRALAPRPDKKRLALALQTFRLATDMPATSVTDRSPTEPAAKRRRAEESAARANAGASSMASAEEGSLASAFGMAAPVAAHELVMRRSEPTDPAAVESDVPDAKRRRLELPPPRPVQVGGGASSGGGGREVVAARTDALATPVGLASFKYEDRVIVASDAKRYSVWLMNPFVQPEAQGGSLKDFVRDFRLEEKKDLPTNFRKFTLLLFKTDAHFTVEGFWAHFAETIGLRPESHEDGIAVCTFPELRNGFAVAYHKTDQRHITVPAGFCGRYVPSATKKGTTRFTMSDILRRVSNLGATQVTNMRIEILGERRRLTAIEAVTAVKSLSPQELSLQRVAASMKKEKERTDIERALTSGWGATKHALELSQEPPIPNRCSIHDTYPVLSSYAKPNAFGAFNYEDIDLVCWVYDPEKDADIKMTFGEVMHHGLYNRRSFVLCGPPGLGKGWFARALAKELAVLTKDPATPVAELVYLYITSMQDLAKVEVCPEVPVVIDEIYLGETMYHDASPGEYLKDATTADEHRSLRLLGKWVHLPAFRRIFTTQAKSVERWCQLKRAPSLDKDDIDAVKRRIIWIRFHRLHTAEQKQHHDKERERVTNSQLENIRSLRQSGAWK